MSSESSLDTITVIIKATGKDKFSVSVPKDSTISDLKEAIEKTLIEAKEKKTAAGEEITKKDDLIPKDQQRLVYSGKVLKDEQTLEFYKIINDHTLHLIKGSQKKPTSSSNNNNNNSSTSTSTPQQLPSFSRSQANEFSATENMFGADLSNVPLPPNTPEEMAQRLNDPFYREMMNLMLSDPNQLAGIMEMSPELRGLFPDEGLRRQFAQLMAPMMRMAMADPSFPNTMMQQMRNGPAPGAGMDFSALSSMLGGASSAGAASNNSATSNTTTPPVNPFSAMLGGFGAGAGTGASPVDNRPPEERYERQLQQLNDMGFVDFDRNVAALRRSGGNVQGAIEALLNGSV